MTLAPAAAHVAVDVNGGMRRGDEKTVQCSRGDRQKVRNRNPSCEHHARSLLSCCLIQDPRGSAAGARSGTDGDSATQVHFL